MGKASLSLAILALFAAGGAFAFTVVKFKTPQKISGESSELGNEIADLSSSLQKFRGNLKSARKDLSDAKKELKEARAEVGTTEAELSTAREELGEVRGALRTAKDELSISRSGLDAEQKTLLASLRERLGDAIEVELELTDEIPCEASGKFRWVISRVEHANLFPWGPDAEWP